MRLADERQEFTAAEYSASLVLLLHDISSSSSSLNFFSFGRNNFIKITLINHNNFSLVGGGILGGGILSGCENHP
ncbi:hypothetical protein AB3S75_013171 [Citrus x aurantiifolia]